MRQTPAPLQEGTQPSGSDGRDFAKLRRMRRFARAVLLFETIWPAIAPALGLLGVFACAALLDLPRLLSPTVHLAALVIGGVAVLALLGRGLRHMRRPSPAEADRRLEADSNLRHQPLAVLSDQPATGGATIWAAHVARARAQITRLRLHAPRPMLAAADPRALRALVLIGLAIGVGVAGQDAWPRLASAFEPGFVPQPLPPAPLVQAWITPPSYTGLPPVFLKPEGGAVTVPAASRLSISVTGGSAAATAPPALDQVTGSTNLTALDATSFQIEQPLTTSGRIAVRRQGHEMAAWDITLLADAPPIVTFPEHPGALRNGTNPQTRLPWQVSHEYGVVSLQAELHLAARPEAPVLTIPIPLPGNAPKQAKGTRVIDLTANPWAGLPVTAQLLAQDRPGLEGRSTIATFILPERRFMNALARAVVAVRRQLSLNPNARLPAINELNRIATLPQVWDEDFSGFLNLRAVTALLTYGSTPESVTEAQSGLWALALHLEEGAPDRTARALEAARQQLQQELNAEQNGAPVDRAELERRIQQLQEALDKRLQALAEQARRDPDSEAYNPDAHPLDQRDMQRLTEDMRDSARKGDTDTTRQKLAELDRMMQALNNNRAERGQMTEQERQRAEKRQSGQQQVTAVQDLIRREGTLLDTAESRAATVEAPTSADHRAGEQRTQLALRRVVGALMQDYGDLTGDVPPSLGEADSAMRDGAHALAIANDAAAAQFDQRAIEALQKGGKSMQQQLARQFGRGQPQSGEDADEGDEDGMAQGEGEGEGEGQYGNQPGNGQGFNQKPGRQGQRRAGQRLDPLGRPHGEGVGGTDSAGDVEVPEQMEQARIHELQEELRRRGADRSRSQDELDYIDRLLKQF